MKIYVLGSNSFVHDMVAAKNKLCELGFDGWIHPLYIEHVNGTGIAFPINEKGERTESDEFKKAHDFIRQHYRHILESDAVLIVNNEKKGKKNYIGGNCLMEMGMAYVNNKKIFLLNDVPTESAYIDEIKAMSPICLNGKLENIRI
ncbi:MAG: hypothetical protein KGJ33_02960 [Patescibacteria group bacterium]|nr:hypothetical protein [Patescibacteria group bacterium]